MFIPCNILNSPFQPENIYLEFSAAYRKIVSNSNIFYIFWEQFRFERLRAVLSKWCLRYASSYCTIMLLLFILVFTQHEVHTIQDTIYIMLQELYIYIFRKWWKPAPPSFLVIFISWNYIKSSFNKYLIWFNVQSQF